MGLLSGMSWRSRRRQRRNFGRVVITGVCWMRVLRRVYIPVGVGWVNRTGRLCWEHGCRYLWSIWGFCWGVGEWECGSVPYSATLLCDIVWGGWTCGGQRWSMLGGEGYNLVFWRWQRDEDKRVGIPSILIYESICFTFFFSTNTMYVSRIWAFFFIQHSFWKIQVGCSLLLYCAEIAAGVKERDNFFYI